MKKGKSRNKRKKTRSRRLWIAIAVIGIAAVISAVCVAGMLATKENAWRTPEELLVEYMNHIPKQDYEEMCAMLHIEASGNVSQEDFVKRNSAIYEGIEVQNMDVQIIAYDEEQMVVTYQTSFDTVAGTISFENEISVWYSKMYICSTTRLKIISSSANRKLPMKKWLLQRGKLAVMILSRRCPMVTTLLSVRVGHRSLAVKNSAYRLPGQC